MALWTTHIISLHLCFLTYKLATKRPTLQTVPQMAINVFSPVNVNSKNRQLLGRYCRLQVHHDHLCPALATDWKRSILSPIPKNGSTKECLNHWTIALISHASKVTLKILHAGLQHYVNQELPDVQAGFRKGRGTKVKLPTFAGSQKK